MIHISTPAGGRRQNFIDHTKLEEALGDLLVASTLLNLYRAQGRVTYWPEFNREAWDIEQAILGYLSDRIKQHVGEAQRAFLGKDGGAS